MKRVTLIALCLIASIASGQSQRAYIDALLGQPVASGEAAPTAQGNLVGWWRFSATDTGASVADASGNGNAMTQSTSSAQPTVASGYGSFDGGDYLSIASTTLLDGGAGYTVTAWVNVTTWVNYAGVIWMRGTHVYGFTTDSSTTKKAYAGRGTTTLISTNTIGTGWVFVAAGATKTSSGNTSFVRIGNGATTGTSAFDPMFVNDAWRIGWDDGSAVYKFNGLIDDVRIYNKQLSSTELNAVMAEGRR